MLASSVRALNIQGKEAHLPVGVTIIAWEQLASTACLAHRLPLHRAFVDRTALILRAYDSISSYSAIGWS